MNYPVAIQLYLDRKEKEAFKRACFLCDTTMSRELRRFIRDYSANPPLPEKAYYGLFPTPTE